MKLESSRNESWKGLQCILRPGRLAQFLRVKQFCVNVLQFMVYVYGLCIETWRASNGAKQLEFGELTGI